jgi:hypothetical protein
MDYKQLEQKIAEVIPGFVLVGATTHYESGNDDPNIPAASFGVETVEMTEITISGYVK